MTAPVEVRGVARRAGAGAASRRLEWAGAIGLGAVVFVHAVLMAYFAPPGVLLGDVPLVHEIYSLHTYDAERAHAAQAGWGRLWAYDPLLLAGRPAGVVFAFGPRAFPLAAIVAGAAGLEPARAVSALVLLLHASVPLAGFVAARLFGLGRSRAAVVAGLWSALWFFDSLMSWGYWSGRIDWMAASGLSVLLAASGFRALAGAGGRGWLLVALALLAVVLVLQPHVLLPLGLVAVTYYGSMWRRAGWLAHVAAAASAAVFALVWLLGLGVPLGAGGEALPGPLVSTLERAVFDVLEVPSDGEGPRGRVRTLLRTLCFAAAGLQLWRSREERGSRVLAALAGASVALGHLGGYVKMGWAADPYLYLSVGMLAAALPAAVLLSELCSRTTRRALGSPERVLLGLAALLVVPRAARTVLFFMPEALPEREIRAPVDLRVSALTGLNEPLPRALRHEAPPAEQRELAGWLSHHHDARRGRVLVQDPALATFLAVATGLPVLGGFRVRGLPGGEASRVPEESEDEPGGGEVAAHLERYTVGLVVAHGEVQALERRGDLFFQPVIVGPYRVLRTRAEPDYFEEGSGHLEATTLNSIRVTGARGDRVTLRFHHAPTLRCRPGCTVEQAASGAARTAFLSVPDPPPAFEIYNAYAL